VIFYSSSALVEELIRAKQAQGLPTFMRQLMRYEALIVDGLGYVQHSREETEALFHLLAERYERGSVLITSHLAFSQWEKIFHDPMTATAAVDRLVHHCVVLELNLPSYRLEAAQRRQTTEQEVPEILPS
jgi:DNA replication protein DnaC